MRILWKARGDMDGDGADGRVWLVRGSPGAAGVPRACACCGAAATRSLRERRPWGALVVLVPYCAPCHRHAASEETFTLALSAATALAAITLTAGLPLALTTPSLPLYAGLVLAGTAMPLVASRLFRERAPGPPDPEDSRDGGGATETGSPRRAHVTAGRAAYFRLDGAFECRSRAFAEALAAHGGASCVEARRSPFSLTPWAVVLVALCFALVVPLYSFHYPVIRVVNASGEALTFVVDGKQLGRVPSTERESEFAGVEHRVPSGRRLLQAFDPTGALVDTAVVEVEAGAHHLYAPGSKKACFRIEVSGFGRRQGDGTSSVPLRGPPYFWVLPSGSEAIDYWFAPAPPPAADARSTGGLVRALRQGACSP